MTAPDDLAAATRAYAAGDFATMGRIVANLPATDPDSEDDKTLARLRGVIAPDPAALYVLCGCLVLFSVLVYRYALP